MVLKQISVFVFQLKIQYGSHHRAFLNLRENENNCSQILENRWNRNRTWIVIGMFRFFLEIQFVRQYTMGIWIISIFSKTTIGFEPKQCMKQVSYTGLVETLIFLVFTNFIVQEHLQLKICFIYFVTYVVDQFPNQCKALFKIDHIWCDYLYL
jgi:hypothetical protein